MRIAPLACAVVLSAVSFTAACEPPACTELAAYSVTAVVVDERGLAFEGATVTYAVDGGAEAPCEPHDNGYACGVEQAGTITVFARLDGFADASEPATVAKDDLGCHVVTEVVQLVMVPTPAT